jgi:hypothetical protein
MTVVLLELIKDEVLLTVSCPIFPSTLIAKNLLTGSLKNRSIDNLETQKKSISMKNSQFFDYLLYALIHVLKEQLGDILFISFVIASGEAIIFYFE